MHVLYHEILFSHILWDHYYAYCFALLCLLRICYAISRTFIIVRYLSKFCQSISFLTVISTLSLSLLNHDWYISILFLFVVVPVAAQDDRYCMRKLDTFRYFFHSFLRRVYISYLLSQMYFYLLKIWHVYNNGWQVPYLEDPNTGVQMFESAEIVEYIRATYALQ